MVRLEEVWTTHRDKCKEIFQFQNGTIRSFEGTTKTSCLPYFNSKMVRLEVLNQVFSSNINQYFNSKMVRLEVKLVLV